ncbi:MAG: hypothetical protein J5910_08430 [Lachnospiraceae bacterium]|nr:hypothetical protein [Lachnospiraceae bacterium]
MPRKKKKRTNQEEPRTKKILKYRKPISINPGVLVFLVIFVYIVIMVFSYFRQTHITPYEVKLGSLAINNTYEGVILREEKVITSDFSGYINYYAREGEKINAYSMVYTVDSTGKLSEMIRDDSSDDSSLSNESLSDIKTAISSFAVDFRPEKYIDTYAFKGNIEGTALKLANTAVLANIDKLRAENYADSIDFGYAPVSGIILYSTDGYEELTAETITPEQVEGVDYEKNSLHSNDLISEGDSAYKLVTSELWSIMIEIDEERAQSLADENYIEVRFLKNNYTAWAAVSVLRQNGRTYAKLDFNNSMITFASDRFVEIELLDNAKMGLKIPNSAIIERTFYLIPEDYLTYGGNSSDAGFNRESYLEDGTLSTEFVPATVYNNVDGMLYVDESVFKIGDYVIKPEDGSRYAISKQASLIGVYNINKGYADFKQITILNQNEEYSIVKSNSEYGLSVYDYIALKGDSVTENDFIYD